MVAHGTIVRVELGDLQGTAVPDCAGDYAPALVTYKEVDSGTVFQTYVCFDPTVLDPCDTGGLCDVLSGTVTIDDCGCT